MVSELNNLSSHTAMDGASSSTFVLPAPITFLHSVSINLDHSNFLFWYYEVQSTIKGYNLQDFIDDSRASLVKFLEPAYSIIGTVNPEFKL